MSQIDYQALRAKAEKATCGEWSLEYGEGRFDGDDALIHREVAGYIPICRIEGAHPESGFDEDFQMEQQANAEFIAAANPATVLALLDELESKDRRNAELEAKLQATDKLHDSAFRDGLKAGFSYGQTDDQSGFTQCMSAYNTTPASLLPDGLIRAVHFYEQVKRENPPVETGAWKDAIDWVLKEACLAASTLESSREHEAISQQEKA
ncbi:TPA: ead/Ea22-like family protein [Salmonella enterica subsp. enterica serovar Kentucky]|nr:ead/Ea22-like family protein [Salmonella enterica subsp. enterica serovar Kentucky]